MTDHPANDQFHASSFMQGHNAEYLEQMYARYANDPIGRRRELASVFQSDGRRRSRASNARPKVPVGRDPTGPRCQAMTSPKP